MTIDFIHLKEHKGFVQECLSNVFPSIATKNEGDRALVHSEFSSQLSLGFNHWVRFSDFLNSGLSKLGMAVFFATHIHVSSTIDAVHRIFLRCSGIKMTRIATRRIVAFVENVKPGWNRAIFNLPSSPMSENHYTNYGGHSIALVVEITNPIPALAFSCAFNAFPKTLRERFHDPSPVGIKSWIRNLHFQVVVHRLFMNVESGGVK